MFLQTPDYWPFAAEGRAAWWSSVPVLAHLCGCSPASADRGWAARLRQLCSEQPAGAADRSGDLCTVYTISANGGKNVSKKTTTWIHLPHV